MFNDLLHLCLIIQLSVPDFPVYVIKYQNIYINYFTLYTVCLAIHSTYDEMRVYTVGYNGLPQSCAHETSPTSFFSTTRGPPESP